MPQTVSYSKFYSKMVHFVNLLLGTIQGYLVFDFDLGFRSQMLRFLGSIASAKKHAEMPKQIPQAKTLAPTVEKYSQI
ncbi:hypothetical protein C6500_10315 [Candidatus Poribacteria bacterium]|nr:MAG: hypothetical protein C6500_10315 [Candidatus Poribacteria bacterium]